MREGVEPEYCISNSMNDEKFWDASERNHIVCASHAIFNGSDKPFNVRNMLVLGAEVEANLRQCRLKWGEFRISMNGIDKETAPRILSDHSFNSFENHVHVTCPDGFDRAKM